MALALAASAQDATFELLKPRNVVEGRNFNITYRLVNAEGNAPEAPELAGCTLLYGPAVSTMASTQIVNGRLSSSSSVDYTFTYRADQAGHVEIPAAAIRTDNGTLRSQGASFEILPARPRRQLQQHRPPRAAIEEATMRSGCRTSCS